MTLEKSTKKQKQQTRNQEFSQRLINGKLSKREYIQYLQVLYSIFSELEKEKLPYEGLKRTEVIKRDIRELNGQVEPHEASEVYIKYLSLLSYEKKLCHIYLNYLDIALVDDGVKDNVPGSGNVYEFENKKKCISSIGKLSSTDWVDEINRGYILWSDIYKNLQKQNNN